MRSIVAASASNASTRFLTSRDISGHALKSMFAKLQTGGVRGDAESDDAVAHSVRSAPPRVATGVAYAVRFSAACSSSPSRVFSRFADRRARGVATASDSTDSIFIVLSIDRARRANGLCPVARRAPQSRNEATRPARRTACSGSYNIFGNNYFLGQPTRTLDQNRV